MPASRQSGEKKTKLVRGFRFFLPDAQNGRYNLTGEVSPLETGALLSRRDAMADEWFYTNDGQQMGPVSIASLRELAARGGLQPSDLVWTEGMSTWAPASASRGLFPSSSTAPQSAPRDVPEVKPADRQRNREPRRWDERERRFERPTPPAGLSTGTKVLIGLGVAGLLAMVGMVAVLMMAGIIAETQAQQRGQNQRNRQFFGGGPAPAAPFAVDGPMNPVPPPPN
jgi:hypothetical protein